MPQDRASADDRDASLRSWNAAALALPRPTVGGRIDAAIPPPPTLRLELLMVVEGRIWDEPWRDAPAVGVEAPKASAGSAASKAKCHREERAD